MDFLQDVIDTENILYFFGLLPLYIDLILRFKDRNKIEFIVEKFYEPSEKPVISDWKIRILHPNKPIEKCSVLYNNIQLPWWDKNQPYYERRFVEMGGGNVCIPKTIQKEDAKIIIKNGKKTLRTVKFSDLLVA